VIKFKLMNSPVEWRWFKERTSVIACEDTQGIVALDRHLQIVAAAVFDTWTLESVNVHLAIDNPMAIRRGLFTEVAVHAYVQNDRKRMFGLVPGNNEKALRLNEKIGFREVARVPDGIHTGVDTVVMRLDREDCRWLPARIRAAA
jgi:hypothetical protein